MIGRALVWFASRNEIRPRPANGVLYEIGDEEGEYQADEPAEDRDVRFMGAGLKYDCP
jgi:hypothetical protein